MEITKENKQQHKKLKEWNIIENILPSINKFLQLDIRTYDDKYSHESPDFVFSNGNKSIGIEIVECHPSVRKCKKRNAPEQVNFEKRICNEFSKNDFLRSITEKEKLYILIDRKIGGEKRPSVSEICNELEHFLEAWYLNIPITFKSKYIGGIKVTKRSYCNEIYFNSISRCIPINWYDLKFSIQEKNQKYKDYYKNIQCNEYWLCICLPYEENRNLNIIQYDGKENEASYFLSQSPFSRICIIPDLAVDKVNINWIKGKIT